MKISIKHIVKFLVIVFIIIFILPILVINLYFKSFIFKDLHNLPTVSAVMIPGAAILKNGAPSPILKERISQAEEVYNSHIANKILITGNSVNPKIYDETNAMKKALLKDGIPTGDIIIDKFGIDTFASMYRAKNTYNITSLIIASQSFHLPRALLIAKSLGINAYGIESDKDGTQIKNYLHEIIAIPKAMLNLIFGRKV
jgi:SanA protein